MKQHGDAEAAGGLLKAQYGRGTRTSAGSAFFRVRSAAVPGAYRLFTNLLTPNKPTAQSSR